MSKNTLLSELINYVSANANGNVVVSSPTSGIALDVNGDGRYTGQLTLGSTITNGTFTYTLPSITGTIALTSNLSSYVPTSRTITINGTTFDLSADRSYTISTGTTLNGTGFVKASGTTISYDNSTYLTSITSSNVTTALGYTPVTNARTLTINGTTFDLTANRSWTISAGTVLNGTGFVKASGTTITYDNSTYVPTNGTGATGTWGISISGTSANTSSISSAVGNAYTWTGAQYFRSNLGGYAGSLSNPPLQVYSDSNNSAFMSFHKGGVYALNMGLDADNVFRIGGWSASANRLQLDMSGNLTLAGDVRTTGLRLNAQTENRGHRIYSRTMDVNSYTTNTSMRFTIAGGNAVQFQYEITYHATRLSGTLAETWYLRYTASVAYDTSGNPNERWWDLREQSGNGISNVGRNNNNGNLEITNGAFDTACRLTCRVAITCSNWDAVTVTFP